MYTTATPRRTAYFLYMPAMDNRVITYIGTYIYY